MYACVYNSFREFTSGQVLKIMIKKREFNLNIMISNQIESLLESLVKIQRVRQWPIDYNKS